MEAIKVYPNPKPHALIRSRMHKLGADGNYMARQLGMSPASFSHRLTGRLPWHADEMYAVMDILKIPPGHHRGAYQVAVIIAATAFNLIKIFFQD